MATGETTWPAGSLIAGRYRVAEELGRGGWGVVLAAHDPSGAEVAIKVLTLDASTQQIADRFVREAEVVRGLHSAHVCRVYETGALDDGTPFIAMERLHGEDLDALLQRRGPVGQMEGVDMVLQACDALAEAHLNGVVHRDLKPSNLFLAQQPDGSALVKLLDFGIAKARKTSLKTLTDVGTVLGSPHYIAPEQLVSSRDVTRHADVWALGVTLFELLTNATVFVGDDVPTLFRAVLRDDPIPLLSLRPDCAPALGSIVGRCLEKDPEARFGSIAELVLALEPFASPFGRVVAGRIQALSSRRGMPVSQPEQQAHQLQTGPTLAGGSSSAISYAPTAPGVVGPTFAGPTAVGPTAVGPTAVGPTAVGPTAVGPTAVGPTMATPPPQPSWSAPQDVTLASQNERRRSPAAYIVGGLAAFAILFGLGIAAFFAASRGKSQNPLSGVDAETPELPEPCYLTDCTVRLDRDRGANMHLLEQARRLATTRGANPSLREHSIQFIEPNGHRGGTSRNTYTFSHDRGGLNITISPQGAFLIDIRDHRPAGLDLGRAKRCPVDAVLRIAQDHFDARPVSLVLTAEDHKAYWRIMDAQPTGMALVAPDCSPSFTNFRR
jgi:eukaryotic-like serine/threonine-protein kinase